MVYILIIIAILVILLLAFNKSAVPVFLYHQVNPISSNVSPETFEEHLKIIKKYNMETITISEYYNNNINKNSMLLTFDDGYYDNFKYVFPLLKKYNMKATIFLNTLYIMDKRENEPEIKDNNTVNLEAMKKYIENGKATINQYMSWEEIKEMYDSGLIDFQAHSHKHMAIFKDIKIEGLTKKERIEAPELYLYGELEDDFPIFAKRGEYSGKAKIIKKEFFSRFEESHLYTNDEVKEYFELIGEPVLEVEDEINENYTVVIPATSSPGTWFTWRKWINRNGIWSSLLMPGLGKVHVIKRYPDRAWSFIYSRHYNSRQWQFYAPEADKSMELQFKYHLYLAQGFKVPWNLEPHKKVKDVKWHCN